MENARQDLCVVLIDMQVDFLPKLRLISRGSLVRNQTRVLQACVEHNIPVVVLEFIGFGDTILPLRKVLKGHYLYRKYRDDAFELADFKNCLEKLGVKKLILIGVNAAFCVMRTAESAVRKGYSIVTSPDLISGQNHHPHDDCRDWYAANGTLLPKTSDVIRMLASK